MLIYKTYTMCPITYSSLLGVAEGDCVWVSQISCIELEERMGANLGE